MHGNHTFKPQVRLLQTPLFCGLDEASLARIARHTKEVHFQKGEVVFREGQSFIGLFIIIAGQVKRYFSSSDGNEKVCDILEQGDCCGEAALFSGKPYGISAEALCDAILLKVSSNGIFEELLQNQNLAKKMMEVLASRTQQMLEAVESLTLLSGSQRTVRYLLEQVKEIEGGGAQVSITLPTTKGVLASHLNLSPEYFSRLLMELQASGLIRVSGRRIDIPNIDRMRECV